MLNRRLSADDRSLTPLSRLLAVAITLKPGRACTSESSSGMGSVFSDRMVMRASCTSAGMRVSSSMRTSEPASMARITGPGTSAAAARPLGEQPGVVPAVAQRLLGRARRALHHEGRRAADGRGEVLAHPRLGRARHAEQQERPVGGQRGDGDLDQTARPEVLRGDLGAVGERAAEQVGRHRPRRQPPAGRAGPVVGGRRARRARRRTRPRRGRGARPRRRRRPSGTDRSWRGWSWRRSCEGLGDRSVEGLEGDERAQRGGDLGLLLEPGQPAFEVRPARRGAGRWPARSRR